MEDKISQSFKVQWINTTLKYLKDDNQLVMEYPDMPVNHMEYLKNLICQPKNEVGIGFKSMYAPVWEAMKIFNIKYEFKVSFNRSADGAKGNLIIEKIPKKEQGEQEPPDAKQENLEQANEDYQSSDSDDDESEPSPSQPGSPIRYLVGIKAKKLTETKAKKKSKKEKFLTDKKKTIESISPVLLKKSLQKILDFLLKNEEASIIFSDLAPVEARFLENFLGIYNRRQSFRGALSPACNEILDKMSEFFKEFDKECKLEVHAAYNAHTSKREVTFMKVPRYTKANAKKSQKFNNSEEKNPKPTLSQIIMNSNFKIATPAKNDAIENREVSLPGNAQNRDGKSSIYKEDKLSMDAENRDGKLAMSAENKVEKLSMNAGNREEKLSINKENREEKSSMNKHNREKKLSLYTVNGEGKLTLNGEIREEKVMKNAGNRDGKLSMNADNKEEKVLMDAGNRDGKLSMNADNKEEKVSMNAGNRDGKLSMNADNKEEKVSMNAGNRDGKLSMNADNKEEKLPANVTKDNKCKKSIKIKDNKVEVLNKDLLKQEIKEILLPKDPVKPILPAKKKEKPTTNNDKIRDKSLGPRKEKLLEAMSTPLESEKAMRMMRLMGWQGGALGLRGEGIVEPIIPALDIVRGSGLGHVKPVKAVKPVKNPPPEESKQVCKAAKENNRVKNRIHFLNTILELINKDTSVTGVVRYPMQFSKKQKRCCNNILSILNSRKIKKFSLTEPENQIMTKIMQVMAKEPSLMLEMMVSADWREISITKIIDCTQDKETHRKKQALVTETQEVQVPNIIFKEEDFAIKMTKSEFKIYLCTTILEFFKSPDNEKIIDFDGILTLKYCRIVEVISLCVNKKVTIPYNNKEVKELSRKILKISKGCFLDVRFEMTPTRAILLRKVYYRKPSVNTEVVKHIIKKYTISDYQTDNTIPDTDKENDHRHLETGTNNIEIEAEVDMFTNKASSNIKDSYTDKTDLNLLNDITKPDSTVSSSVIDVEEIKENKQKMNATNDCNDDLKLNDDKANNCENIKKATNKKLQRFPLYVKDSNTDDHIDFRKIDMDLIQVTINSLTSHNKNTNDVTEDRANYDFNINDNLKYTESSKLSDKLNIPCEITYNVRKWYEHSEKFLICDDLVKNIPVKNIDSNNNRNPVADIKINKDIEEKIKNIDLNIAENCVVADIDDVKIEEIGENNDCNAIELEIWNKDVEIHSQLDINHIEDNNTQDLNLTDENEACDGLENSINEMEFKESHHVVEKYFETDKASTSQVKENNIEDLKPMSVPENCSSNKNSLIESEESDQAVKTYSIMKIIQIESDNKQDFNDVKYIIDEIELKIPHQIEKHSLSNIITIEKDNSEDLNTISVTEALTYDIKDNIDAKNLNQTQPVEEKNFELDIIEVKINNEQDLSVYGIKDSLHSHDVIQLKTDNEDVSYSDYDTEKSSESSNTEDTNSKLDSMQVGSGNKDDLVILSKNGPDEMDHNVETHSRKDKIQIEENDNIKDLTLTHEFETDESKKPPEEDELIKIQTGFKENLSRKRKYEVSELDESYDALEVKHKYINPIKNDTIEDSRLINVHLTADLEDFKTREEINSKLDISQMNTDCKENLTLVSELEKQISGENKKVSSKLDLKYNNDSKQIKENQIKDIMQAKTDNKENLTLASALEIEKSDQTKKSVEINSKLDKNHNNDSKHVRENQIKDVIQIKMDKKENPTIVSESEIEKSDGTKKGVEINPKLDIDSKHGRENLTKDLNNTKTVFNKTCHDIVLIESNILEVEVIQKKIQNTIENIHSEIEFLPLLKYHGILNSGIVYSCHNKETSLWLRNILSDYSVIDYKSAINNYKLKIKVASVNKDAKKFLELLEIYNQGLKSQNWKIISEKHYNYSIILVAEMDRNSFEYICDNNFSLSVGYDVAQFSIGC